MEKYGKTIVFLGGYVRIIYAMNTYRGGSVLEKCDKKDGKNSYFSRPLLLGSFVFERACRGLGFYILDPCMQRILLGGFCFEKKYGKNMGEKTVVFPGDYGRIVFYLKEHFVAFN